MPLYTISGFYYGLSSSIRAFQAQSDTLAKALSQIVLLHAEALGFSMILSKSDLVPGQEFLYLALVLFTVSWSVKPPPVMVEQL